MKEDIADIRENLEETRNGVNMLINWSEKVSMAATFPLPDIDDGPKGEAQTSPFLFRQRAGRKILF